MLVCLPESLRQTTYHALSKLWQDRTIPNDWKTSILRAIPKVKEDITLNDLRPLKLIEVARKLWAGIFVNRIKCFWQTWQVIHNSQHAYTAERGVDTVHTQHRNMVEEAEEIAASLYYSSWDVKRAFDRVPKAAIRMALHRTGIPLELANYLVDLDEGGRTIVSTPLTRRILREQGINGFAVDDTTQAPCFIAEVGSGQGDIPSPFNWKAFFDILLVALAEDSDTPFLVRSENHTLTPADETGYADDLLSSSGKLEGLQTKADMVSAFSIIFGLEIAVHKLRVAKLQWGAEDEDREETLIIHQGEWGNTIEVQVRKTDNSIDAGVKYLGHFYNDNNTCRKQYNIVTAQIRQDFMTLKAKTGPPDLKTDIAEAGILSKAVYSGKLSSWSLDEMEKIDTLFATHHRQILGIEAHYPTELIYAPKEVCGVGITRFSDRVNNEKLRMVHRALRSEPPTARAMEGLLHRALRYAGTAAQPGIAQEFELPMTGEGRNRVPLWADSLITWLAKADIRINTGGESAQNTLTESVVALATRHLAPTEQPIDIETINRLNLHCLWTLGDIVEIARETNDLRMIGTQQEELSMLGDLPRYIQTIRHPIETTSIAPSQCWLTDKGKRVTEIIGWVSNSHMTVRRWIPDDGRMDRTEVASEYRTRGSLEDAGKEGQYLALDPDTLSHGAGTLVNMTFEEIFPAGQREHCRIILSEDRTKHNDGALRATKYTQHKVWRKVLHRYQLPRPQPMAPPTPADRPLQAVDRPNINQHLELIHNSAIFTDGSYEKHGCPINAFFGLEHDTRARAAVIIQPIGNRTLHHNTIAIRITDGHIIPGVNAYHMELLSAMLASKIRFMAGRAHGQECTANIWTDCKAVQDLANEQPNKPWKHNGFPLLQSLWRTQAQSSPIQWVRSHAEKTKKPQDWTAEECGNVMADNMASAQPTQRPSDHIRTTDITTRALLQTVLSESKWTLTQHGLPLLTSPLELVKLARWEKDYIHKRDDNRIVDHKNIKWQNLSLRAAAGFHGMERATHTRRARVSRIVYNWYFTGAKRARCAKEQVGVQYTTPEVCPLCKEEDDTQCHLVCACDHDDTRRTRERIQTEIKEYIRTNLKENSTAWRCAQSIYKLADTSSGSINPHYIWLGTWSPQQIQTVKEETGCNIGHIADNHPVHTVIKDLGKIFAYGALAMLDARHHGLKKARQATSLLKKKQRNPHRSAVSGL